MPPSGSQTTEWRTQLLAVKNIAHFVTHTTGMTSIVGELLLLFRNIPYNWMTLAGGKCAQIFLCSTSMTNHVSRGLGFDA